MTHVPAQFVGLARAFRARVGADDALVGQTVNAIAAPLIARRKRKPTFRPETLIDAERQFRRLPSAGRLMLKVERGKSGLRIEEHRIAAGQFCFCRWDDDARDADIGIVKVILEATEWGPVGATAKRCVISSLITSHAPEVLPDGEIA
jgi:hypothetical protein